MGIEPMLAKKYDNQNISNWYYSEKYDGVRAIWTGKKLVTRNGNAINAPEWFTRDLPEIALDGELWMGRGNFQKVVGIARRKTPIDSDWLQVKYMIFDAPESGTSFIQRIYNVHTLTLPGHCIPVKHCKIKGFDLTVLMRTYNMILRGNGEGLILRNPQSFEYQGRSSAMLKMKPVKSSEAVITGHKEGKGAKSGMVGALMCKWGKVCFSVGSGLSDQARRKTPPIGSIVTFTYQGLTDSGKPRFPIFQTIRDYE